MSDRTYRLAVILHEGIEHDALRRAADGRWYLLNTGTPLPVGYVATIVRPLVVLDPEDTDLMEAARQRFIEGWEEENRSGNEGNRVRSGLRAMLKGLADRPEMLTEPLDPAARVIDKDDDEWARNREGLWACLSTRTQLQAWPDLFVSYGPLTVIEP